MHKFFWVFLSMLLAGCADEPGNQQGSSSSDSLTAVELRQQMDQQPGIRIWVFMAPEDTRAKEMLDDMRRTIETSMLRVEVEKIQVAESFEGLPVETRGKFTKKIRKKDLKPETFQEGWQGDLPAIFIVDHDEDLSFFYQQYFSPEEFYAILQTVTF